MFKVRFKDNFKKIQIFNNKAIIVSLKGTMDIPIEVWQVIPNEVSDWLRNHPSVEAEWNDSGLLLRSSGKAICAEEDTYDAIRGERIAEARAKLKIYRFVYTFCKLILNNLYSVMYGDAVLERVIEKPGESSRDSIYRTFKKYRGLMIKEAHHLGELLNEI